MGGINFEKKELFEENSKGVITFENRKSVFADLRKFDPSAKEHDYIEVIGWSNGEGWDVNICNRGQERHLSLHYDELAAINFLTKALDIR